MSAQETNLDGVAQMPPPIEKRSGDPLIAIRDLKVHFPISGKTSVKAVDGVTIDIYHGETLGWSVNPVVASPLLGAQFCGWSNQHPDKCFTAIMIWPIYPLANCASIVAISRSFFRILTLHLIRV